MSLVFIASHGVERTDNESEYGALRIYNPDTGEKELVPDTTLAQRLSEIPGEVVVILEACSSGSAIYDSDAASAALNAFARADRSLFSGIDSDGNTATRYPRVGGLRRTKFHVLTSSAHREFSYAYTQDDFPHTLFTYGLTQAVGEGGRMPCDANGDGAASLKEIVDYFADFTDPWLSSCVQYPQYYLADPDYALFWREE